MFFSNLPENNETVNLKLFLLDPLTVIIKLAILSNKPVGTKLLIKNNIIYLQEPGLFQGICRIIYNSNKTDLQFMYNPIQIACSFFLSKESLKKIPRIKNLFIYAQNGLKKLMETYKNSSIIFLCLNYYYAIITNFRCYFLKYARTPHRRASTQRPPTGTSSSSTAPRKAPSAPPLAALDTVSATSSTGVCVVAARAVRSILRHGAWAT
jgi:hypothetical protein